MVEIKDLKPGDKILWDNRKEPATVLDEEWEITDEKLSIVGVETKRGTHYIIHDDYLVPKLKRVNDDESLHSRGEIGDIRLVDE